MNVFGLDIGSTSIKFAQVAREGEKFRLISAGLVAASGPGLLSEAETDHTALATTIKKLHQEAKVNTRKVVIALPEGQIFSRIIEIPPMNEEELSQAIPWEAEQFVPVPLDEVTLDWQVLGQFKGDEEKVKVFVVAAPKTLVEKYLKVLEMAGLEVVAVDTEILAMVRSLTSSSSPPTILVDIGARATVLAIVKEGQIILTRSIPTAGEALTRAISTSLSLEMPQAEQYKIAYGLDEKKLEGRVKKALEPVFKVIIEEIKKTLDYWKEKEKDPIKEIILCGGSANLPEAATILTTLLGIQVSQANPFRSLIADEKLLSGLRDQVPLFATAVGLAQKEV